MRRTAFTILFLFITISLFSMPLIDTAFTETPVTLHTSTGDIFGTLTIPKNNGKTAIVLIIAGSGPTDRNGNNPQVKNGNLQKLAYSLSENNISSLRFDKRGIGESKSAAKSEADLRFEDYINDAKSWINLLKKDNRFSKVIVAGHSEGSLIGMIAAHHLADGFISIAGAGRSADKILKEQLGKQPSSIQDICFPIIDSLAKGILVADVTPMLFSLFRPGVQPYMISWFHYNPQTEIKKLDIPVLILQGTNDIQVSAEDAQLLSGANTHGQLVLIKNMNHIFRIVEGDRDANIATYNNSTSPISEELVKSIVKFIKN